MKQVWQAEDGSVFQTEEEANSYEDKRYFTEKLLEQLNQAKFGNRTAIATKKGIDYLIQTNPSVLKNYINATMEQQDAN